MYFIKNADNITIFFDDLSAVTLGTDDPVYSKIEALLKENSAKNEEIIQNLTNLNKCIIEGNFKIKQDGDKVIFSIDGSTSFDASEDVVENHKFLRLVKIAQDMGIVDDDIKSITPFLKKVADNAFLDPEDLYKYLKHGDFKITEEGNILAYKNVGKDLKSIYDNTTEHHIGEYTTVTLYDTDRSHTCSNGLHFATKGYLPHYGGPVTIVVEVDPRDIVSIPYDYDNMKGRCRRYKTIAIIDQDKTLNDMDFEKATNNETKVLRVKRKPKIVIPTFKNRIEETAYWMKDLKGNIKAVANKMNISPETVKRNMRRYKNASNV